jgi:triosephosphate isomerase
MLIAANWKMNLNKFSIEDFAGTLYEYEFTKHVKLCIFPSIIHVNYLKDMIATLPVAVGGQTCHYEKRGAFTGDISADALLEAGCEYVLLGHSERRKYHNESNSFIKKCATTALHNGLIPIICVGENIQDREDGIATKVVENQLNECMPDEFGEIVIAYEPLWSIGTGKIPTMKQIMEMHGVIKQTVGLQSKLVKVLYGGSVNISNASEILSVDNVDGLLVGGASLHANELLQIYNLAAEQCQI